MKLNFKGEGTKVQQLTDFIQESIALNNLKAGDALPSINELSKEFAVSRDTVFKSFSDLKLHFFRSFLQSDWISFF